jgi:ribosomal protein L20
MVLQSRVVMDIKVDRKILSFLAVSDQILREK